MCTKALYLRTLVSRLTLLVAVLNHKDHRLDCRASDLIILSYVNPRIIIELAWFLTLQLAEAYLRANFLFEAVVEGIPNTLFCKC